MQLIKTVQKLKDGGKIAKQIKRIEALRAEIERMLDVLKYTKQQIETQLQTAQFELDGSKIKLAEAYSKALKWKWGEEELQFIHNKIGMLGAGLSEHPNFHKIEKQHKESLEYIIRIMDAISDEDMGILNSEFFNKQGLDFETLKNGIRDPQAMEEMMKERFAQERLDEQKEQHTASKSGAHFSDIEDVNYFIKTIYKKLCKFFHPDKVMDPTQKNIHQEKLQMVNNWYQNGDLDKLLELFISDLKEESKTLLESQQAAILKKSIKELHDNLESKLEAIKQDAFENDIPINSKLEVPGLIKSMKKEIQMEIAEHEAETSELQTKARAKSKIDELIWQEYMLMEGDEYDDYDEFDDGYDEDDEYDDEYDDEDEEGVDLDLLNKVLNAMGKKNDEPCMCEECVKERKLKGKK